MLKSELSKIYKGEIRQLEHKNQFTVENDHGKLFISYDSAIALIKPDKTIYIDSYYWDYSKTTVKHLCIFLNIGWSKKNIQKGIDSGKYILTQLNNSKVY